MGLRYPILLAILEDGTVPTIFRAAVCKLLVALFVDREPFEYKNPVQYIRVWEEVLTSIHF